MHRQQGRFARTAGSDDAGRLPGAERKIHIVQDRVEAKAFDHGLGGQHWPGA